MNCFTFFLAFHSKNESSIEEREFGAWGEVDFIKINGQEADFSDSILARGFTGHEHFSEIALIHMNGRMYDPQLRRFLSPDNNIINPFDTRSFDRMAYAFHNPLAVVDIDGELPALVIIAAVVSAYLGGLKANDFNLNPLEWEYNIETIAFIIAYAVIGGLTAGQALGVEGLSLSGTAGSLLTGAQLLTTTDFLYNLNDRLNNPITDTGALAEDSQNYFTNQTNNGMVASSPAGMGGLSGSGHNGYNLSEEIPNSFSPEYVEEFLPSPTPELGDIPGGGGSNSLISTPIGSGGYTPGDGEEENEGEECPKGQIPDGNGGCIENPFNTSSLSDQEEKDFLESINNLLDKCLGKALVNSITNVNVITDDLPFGSVAQYRASSNSIVFNKNSVGDGLGAELFHSYQQQLYGTLIDISSPSTGHLGGSNIEFEEKAFNIMMQIIEQNNKANEQASDGSGVFVGEIILYNEETEFLYYWIDEFLHYHGVNFVQNLSQSELDTWFEAMEQFQQHHFNAVGCGNGIDLYGCPIDYNLNPNVTLALFNKAIELNCLNQ